MAPLTQWAWVWASSRRWWRTEKPVVLQSMGSQRVGHDLATEQQQQHTQPLTYFLSTWIFPYGYFIYIDSSESRGLLWLIPWPILTFVRFFDVLPYISTLFLFIADNISLFEYMDIIHLSVHRHLSCCNFGAIMNIAAMDICIQVSVWRYVFGSFQCIPRSGLAQRYNSLHLSWKYML